MGENRKGDRGGWDGRVNLVGCWMHRESHVMDNHTFTEVDRRDGNVTTLTQEGCPSERESYCACDRRFLPLICL